MIFFLLVTFILKLNIHSIPFFLWFFKYRKPLKRIATLTSRKAIENSPHNKKLVEQQKPNLEESSKESKEESSETKFNQILFSSAPGEVEETETKTKTKTETSKTTKIENPKEIKKINVISSKVDKQIFFDVVDKIQDEEIQRTYLQNLKNLILTENPNKTQEIKPNQYSMDEIYNRFKKTQRPITIKDLEEEIKEIKSQINQLKLDNEKIKLENEIIKQENDQIKQENEQIRNVIQYKQDLDETSENQEPGIIIPNKITPIESFINTISKIDFQRWYTNVKLIVEDFEIEIVALIDSGADMNCIQEGIIPTKYYEKTGQELFAANKGKLDIEYKLQNVHVSR